MEVNQIYQGHTPDVLKSFPDDSIDCFITSPPYWSLRDYKLEPQIWDGDENCEHEWEINIREHPMDRKGATGNLGNAKSLDEAQGNIEEEFCSLCGAWRGSLGLEPTFKLYLKHLIQIFDEVKRVLKPTGTCWVNLGDSYSGIKIGNTDGKNTKANTESFIKPKTSIPAKSLCAIPERFKIMMIDRGWICRNTIIWYKRNCMPSSASDRFTVDFEYVYFFVKNQKYWFEQQFEPNKQFNPNDPGYRPAKIKGYKVKSKKTLQRNKEYGCNSRNADFIYKLNPMRNKRCVWDVTTQPYSEAHFATFPERLVEPMIRAGCPKKGIVLDPFIGSGTVAKVAKRLKRNWVGIELNPEYIKMAGKRIKHVQMELL